MAAYLTSEILAGFDKYKYNAVDTSPVSKYITHPFWNWVVEFCPRWVAPNALTLGGLLFLVAQFLTFSYYDYHFYASDDTHPEHAAVPDWVWLWAGICMFMAHNLDGIDGKQARRTGTGSALGELFDHGIDSWATLFMPVGMVSIFGRGDHSLPLGRIYFVLFGVMLTFLASHWEKYNTGVMYLPWGYDISQIAMTAGFCVTYFGGYRFWKCTLPGTDIPVSNVFEFIMAFSVFAWSVPVSVWNVYVSYRDGTGKMRSLYENLRPLIAPGILWTCFLIWSTMSPYGILEHDPRLVFFASGTVFSNIACRLIVSGMSNTRCHVFNWLLIPLIAIVVGVLTLNLGVMEYHLLRAYAILVLAAHLHYAMVVVQQLADHLNIYIFSVKKRPKSD